MAEIINLRQVRKAKDRLQKQAQGHENAVKFGRSKNQQKAEIAAAEKARRDLDGHEREGE
jgi:hypothetical protein